MIWRRAEAEASVSDNLWRFSGASRFASGEAAPVALGEAISPDAFSTIIDTYLAISPAADAMLSAVAHLLGRTPGRVFAKTTETVGEVEGAVDWPMTFERQLRTGDETTFVCRFGRRRFETLGTRLMRTALVQCDELNRTLAHDGSPAGQKASETLERDRLLQRHPKLTGVRPLEHPTEAQLTRAAARVGMAPVVGYLRLVRDVHERVPGALRRLFDDVVLTPAEDDRLFELQVGFAIVEAFTKVSWTLELLQVIAGAKLPFAVLKKGDSEIRVWHQRSLGSLGIIPGSSRYSEYRVANRLKASSLLPDFVIELPGNRTVLVEVKLTTRLTTAHVRQGISDAMAYLHDWPALTVANETPHALVVAWGTEAVPSLDSPVAVCGLGSVAVLSQLANADAG